MIKSTNRQVFSDNLRMAVMADEIASSLRHISQSKRIENRDRRILSMAEEVLTEMLRGRDATKNRMVEVSFEGSLAYGQAIQAIQLHPARFALFDSFDNVLSSLTGQLKEVAAEKRFDVDDVYEFFSAIRELAMAGGNRKVESVTVSGVE